MTALTPDTGRVLWRTAYPAPFEMLPATRRHGPGPKSTPVFADGRLFALGMTGAVIAFDAETGRQLWQNRASAVQPLYHTGQSPVVDGDNVIVHVGGHDDGALTAFDVATGDVRWSWDGDGPAYGSPMVFELAGERQVVTFTQEHMVGVAATTGQLLWERPFTTPHTTTSQTPILYGELVIQAGRDNGITAFRVARGAKGWSTQNVWETDEVSMHMSNGVVIDGVLFGLVAPEQRSVLRARSGEWRGPLAERRAPGGERSHLARGRLHLRSRGRRRASGRSEHSSRARRDRPLRTSLRARPGRSPRSRGTACSSRTSPRSRSGPWTRVRPRGLPLHSSRRMAGDSPSRTKTSPIRFNDLGGPPYATLSSSKRASSKGSHHPL